MIAGGSERPHDDPRISPHPLFRAARRGNAANARIRSPASKRDLRPPGDDLVALADLDLAGRVLAVHVDDVVVQHEPDVVVRIPAEAEADDLLLAAENPAGGALRDP